MTSTERERGIFEIADLIGPCRDSIAFNRLRGPLSLYKKAKATTFEGGGKRTR